MDIELLVDEGRLNTFLSWSLTAVIFLVFLQSVSMLDIPWIVFTAFLMLLVLVPPRHFGDVGKMLPWELLFIASIPVIVRAFSFSILANQVATYISFGAVAMIIAMELRMLTSLKFNHAFSILFVVVSTLAVGAVWSVLRFYLDVFLGTGYLTTNEALMQEYVNILVAGLSAGILFDIYFRKREALIRKLISRVI